MDPFGPWICAMGCSMNSTPIGWGAGPRRLVPVRIRLLFGEVEQIQVHYATWYWLIRCYRRQRACGVPRDIEGRLDRLSLSMAAVGRDGLTYRERYRTAT